MALSAAAIVFVDLLRAKRDTTGGFGASCGGLCLHSGLDLRGHGEESLFNVVRCFGGSFQEFNPKRVGKFLALFGRDDTLGSQIALVTNQKLVDVFCGVSVNFVQPLLHIVEGIGIRHVVNNNDTVGTTVVGRGDGSETLLSGSIPNLQFDSFCFQFNSANFEIDTNGGNVGFGVGIISKSQKQT